MTTTDCPHIATVTGAAVVTLQRMCQREADVIWLAAPGEPTVCVTCNRALPEPEEAA